MAVGTVLKQPEKNPRETQVKRDGHAIIVQRREASGEIALRNLSHICLHIRSARDHTEWLPQRHRSRVRLSRQSVLKVPVGSHTSSHPNYTWGIPGSNICWEPILQYPFRHWGNFVFIEAPGPFSPRATSVLGLSGQAKFYYFRCSLSCNWDSVLFSYEFLIVPKFPSHLLGRDMLSKVHASVFMNMELSLSLPLIEQNVNSKVWADGKTRSSTKCCSWPYQAQRPSYISMSKAVSTKAWG